MTQGDNIISIQSVSKHFGPVKAVDDTSFNIKRGEFFSLLGPSGCGKTTLLRILAGFELPTSGEVTIDGQPMSTVPPHARPTNMVFQSYAIFPHLNVRENIAYGLRKRRLGKAETARIVEQALELIKMPGYGERRSDQLSGGQRQRVALARALVCQPKVLLLDEPLGALDKKLREEMQIELRQIQRTVGITFVFVTHDQEEALTLSDRIAVMSRGKVLQIDHSTRLYEAPNCREVAEFIGTMNILPGTIGEVSHGRANVAAGTHGAFEARTDGSAPRPGTPVLIAIRPEKLQMSWERPGLSVNSLAGKVGAVAYFGDRSHFYVDVEGCEKPLAVALQNGERRLDGSDLVGKPVWLSWEPDSAVLLPA
ncbi:ABC transporter ATP-binding protein [Dongia deserti]|uniref:ABC transporter ATP-binding protein n=1 Tax=Dongia deserti TaxID=2268030 RepID=UPI000E64B3DC|nr:ABC transporter ATP-binding protein [Dongia deserti]